MGAWKDPEVIESSYSLVLSDQEQGDKTKPDDLIPLILSAMYVVCIWLLDTGLFGRLWGGGSVFFFFGLNARFYTIRKGFVMAKSWYCTYVSWSWPRWEYVVIRDLLPATHSSPRFFSNPGRASSFSPFNSSVNVEYFLYIVAVIMPHTPWLPYYHSYH